MKKINLAKLKWKTWQSPKGKFAQHYKNLSFPLGDAYNGWPKKGHPFNVELISVPAGKSACPFHWHMAQWEFYHIVSGTGFARRGKERTKIRAGDAFIHPPGEAHQIVNTGKTPLVFYVIADNPPMDGCFYPDSNKWMIRKPRKIFRMTEADYHDGEE